MIEGHIEAVLPAGLVTGWVRDTERNDPCHILIRRAGHADTLAEAVAGLFRRDLLRAGHGNGHYGFRARLAASLPAGRCTLELHLPRLGQTAPMAITVPKLLPFAPARVEDFLRDEEGWTNADLLDHPACLGLDRQLAAMGAPRLVDALYRFVLSRWPSEAEAGTVIRALEAERVTPEILLRDLLTCRERADMPPGLPAPSDPRFPF